MPTLSSSVGLARTICTVNCLCGIFSGLCLVDHDDSHLSSSADTCDMFKIGIYDQKRLCLLSRHFCRKKKKENPAVIHCAVTSHSIYDAVICVDK